MIRSLAIALCLCGLSGAPAFALGGGGGSSSATTSSVVEIDWLQGDGDFESDLSATMETLGVPEGHPRIVVMPAVVVPLVYENHLVGYAYIHSRLLVAEGRAGRDFHERTHFALDALVRASHRQMLTNDDGQSINIDRMREVWMDALNQRFGEGVIERIGIMRPDTRLIH